MTRVQGTNGKARPTGRTDIAPWTAIALAAIGYVLLALAARLTTLLDDMAPPIWLPTGFALAAVIMWGARAWPGIWLGAFFSASWLTGVNSGPVAAAVVGSGAAIHALVGLVLVRHLMDTPMPLTQERDIGRFLLFGGPVACGAASLFLAAGLHFFGPTVVPDPAGAGGWWLAQTLGVVLFAPLALLAWRRTPPLWSGSRVRVALPLLVTAGLLAAGHQASERIERDHARTMAHAQIDDTYQRAFLMLETTVSRLRGVERLFAASDEVTALEFATYTGYVLSEPGVLSVDWAPRLRGTSAEQAYDSAPAHLSRPHRIVEPDADDVPRLAANRDEYFPVLYSAQQDALRAMPGLDHGFEAVRRVAMIRARDVATPVAVYSDRVPRVGRGALLVFMPTFAGGLDQVPATEEERRRSLLGFVVLVFDVEGLLSPLAAEAAQRNLQLRITDVTPGQPDRVLVDTLTADKSPDWQRQRHFAGRLLRTEMQPASVVQPPDMVAQEWAFDAFSLVGACLVAFASLGAAGRNALTATEVRERTASLQRELEAREAAEQGLVDSEARYRRFVEFSPFGVFVQCDGQFVFVNPKTLELLGAQSDMELIGQSVLDRLHPGSREAVRERIRLLNDERVMAPPLEEKWIRLDGSVFHGEATAVPYDFGGRNCALVLLQDITTRKEAETQRDQFFNLSPTMLMVGDGEHILQISPAVTDLLGWTLSELHARPWIDFVHPDDRAGALSASLKSRSGTSDLNFECRWQCRDGRWLWLSWSIGFHDGLQYAVAIDITEQRRMLAQYNEARRAAEEASRAKSAFLATMSHEIRTPMNGILGMIEVLSHSKLSAHQKELAGTIRESAEVLLGIIDDILDFSKIEAERLELEVAPVSIVDLVEGLCNSLVPVAARKAVELRLFISPELPGRVLADDVRVRQVLYNLIGNAMKFSAGRPNLRGRVWVRAEVATDEPLRMRFAISDNGIGMDAATIGKLFSPFAQAEVSTTRRYGGTGLGLPICKRLVDLMNGSIEVDSTLGEGSTFTVTLPLQRAPDQPTIEAPDLAGLECVVIESAEFEADDLRIYLEHAGARVRIVHDPASAACECVTPDAPVVVIRAGTRRRAGGLPTNPEGVRQVVITRGRRRRARIIAADTVGLDGGALRRGALLHAVAVAAGRASPEAGHEDARSPLPGEIQPPTVGEAREAGRLILVVEDDAINRKVILQQLALLGHAAEFAGDGAEALKMWRSGHHALVLSDLHMPKMDGYALAEAIRREERACGGPRTPILALTANALRGEAHRTLAIGIDEHLTKPIRLSHLREALERWLPTQRSNVTGPAPPPVERNDTRPPVDPDVLRELTGGDEAVMRELLGDYLAVLGTQGEALRQAIAVPDLREVGRIAHKLKSSSRAIGATGLGDLCADLDDASTQGDSQSVANTLGRLVETVAAVRSGIFALLSEQPGQQGGPLGE